MLLNRARSLEPAALTEIHNLYYTPIFRYILLRVDDYEAAEDMTSEVFVRLLGALRDRTAPQNTLRGWLFAVASHVVKDFYRQRYRAPQVELADSLVGAEERPDEQVESNLTREALRQAISQLSEEQQDAVALRFGFGLSISETAQTMGKSEGSIKMLQARAVAALTRRLLPGSVSG